MGNERCGTERLKSHATAIVQMRVGAQYLALSTPFDYFIRQPLDAAPTNFPQEVELVARKSPLGYPPLLDSTRVGARPSRRSLRLAEAPLADAGRERR
jgi:hypothetical protein